jgi:hypothetical protein
MTHTVKVITVRLRFVVKGECSEVMVEGSFESGGIVTVDFSRARRTEGKKEER